MTAQKNTRREVVGILSRREDFDAAVKALTAAGFSHTDLSVLASHDSIDAADPKNGSWKESLVGLLGELRYQGPLVAAGFIALIADPIAAVLATAIAAGVGGVAVKELLDEVTARPHTAAFAKALADGQLLLWVLAADAEHEALATRILTEAKAAEVHTNERKA